MLRSLTTFATGLATGLGLSLLTASPLAAQEANLFAPRMVVNDRVISNFEVAQRTLFLQLLRAPGDPEKMALQGLIDDRLRMQEAERLDMAVTPEQLQTGMDEFAGRANMTAEQFITALGQAGVEAQTFRDFVEAGLLWREVVKTRFGAYGNVSDAEIDRAIEGETRKPNLRVLLSELIIPAPPGQEAAALATARSIKASVSSEGGFAAAVAQHSAAASRGNGGRLDWMPLSNLPPTVAPFVLALGAGEVSDPLPIPGGVALFQLRGVEELPPDSPAATTLDYAQVRLPADGSATALLAELQQKSDACNDLYALAEGLPEDQLIRTRQPVAEVPADLGLELARMDPGEHVVLNRGGAQLFLQLCSREPTLETPISRDEVRKQLVNQHMASRADLYLRELQANAIIREP